MAFPTALFICNSKFLNTSFPEGGVKFCTDEYIQLIKQRFEVIPFSVDYNNALFYKIKKTIGLSVYEDYKVEAYRQALAENIVKHNIKYVFLNLTNTATFAPLIKQIAPQVKIILCSHGNESGDFLHDIAGHEKYKPSQKKIATYALGKTLITEYGLRKSINVVLTVSEVELNIEKWLGASKIYMVARTIGNKISDIFPVAGKVGFLGDLNHQPNYYGIKNICEELASIDNKKIQLQLVGSGKIRGEALQKEYSFVKYIGHLSNEQLYVEINSWTFALNPVFYYSRGVSTKLGKILGAGIPVITTDKGLRGYTWNDGELPVCSNAFEMAELIIKNSNDKFSYTYYRSEVKKIQQSAPSLATMMTDILKLIDGAN